MDKQPIKIKRFPGQAVDVFFKQNGFLPNEDVVGRIFRVNATGETFNASRSDATHVWRIVSAKVDEMYPFDEITLVKD